MSAPQWLKNCWQGCRLCARGIGRLVRWCVWLILIFTAIVQVIILNTQNLRVPDFVLAQIEANLGSAGLKADFGEVKFDPIGRILLEDVDLSLAVIGTPVMQADSIYLEVDPWALWWREIDPRQVRFSGVDLLIPAALSPSGQSEALVSGIDATLKPTETPGMLALEHFTARVGTIPLSIHGAVQLPTTRSGPAEPWDQLMSKMSSQYVTLCREAGRRLKHLEAVEGLRLSLQLEPNSDHIAHVKLEARASVVNLPFAALADAPPSLRDIRLVSAFDLTRDAQTLAVNLSAAQIQAPFQLDLNNVSVGTEVSIDPSEQDFKVGPIQVTIDEAQHPITGLSAVTAETDLSTLPILQTTITSRLAGEPVRITSDVDVTTRAGRIAFAGNVSSDVLEIAAEQINFDVPSILKWEEPPYLTADINLGDRGRPIRAEAKFTTQAVEARWVPLSATAARVLWEGEKIRADQIMLRTGPSIAYGSYEMNTATRDFQFLLRGQLEPISIKGWFRDWWVKLFDQFDFTGGLPQAKVEVAGRWGAKMETRVFVSADARNPIVREIPMNRMRTRLFTRPGWADVHHFLAERSMGDVEGSFLRQWNMPDSRRWTRVEIHAGGVTDMSPAPKLLRRTGDALIAPFDFEQPLTVRLDGQAVREDWGEPVSETFDISGSADGAWRFKDFPFEGTSFRARRENDLILIRSFEAGMAGGELEGRIELQGRGDEQQVAFDLNLADASLGGTMHDVSAWLAKRRGEEPKEETEFEKQMANGRLTVAVTAEGPSNNLLGLNGSGSAAITDANFTNINLFGVLSAMLERTILNFSTLQLNHANADFTLQGPRVVFSQVKATGDRGAVDATGEYSLADRSLDFTTRVRPFDGGEGLLGAVFTPFASALEVKLTGELSDPEWTFVYGPTNFLRNLTGENARNRNGTSDAEDEAPSPSNEPTTSPSDPGLPTAEKEGTSPDPDLE